jgi:antirestriction protein ArdC
MTTTTSKRSALTADEKTARLEEAHNMIANAVEAIITSEDWIAHLRFAARFHKYSFNNVLLMAVQADLRGMNPLTRVAGFKAWLELGRCVRKGEKGLKIYAPIIVKIKEGEQGYPGTKVAGFRLTTVFDAQQTDGEALPGRPQPTGAITGTASAAQIDALGAVGSTAGYAWRYGDSGPADGYTVPGEIVVSESFRHDSAQTFAILAHETAHALLHMDDDFDYGAHRGVGETEAESVAFIVAEYFGVSMGDTAFHYVAGWAKDPAVVVAAGQRIMKTARKIIDAVEAATASE